MLHFITRIVICSFGFRKSTAVPPVFLSGRLFLFVSAQSYITLTILAILAQLSFQLLYELVVDCYIHVANSQPHCNEADNFNTVSRPLKERKKRYFQSLKSSVARIEPLLFFIAKHPLPYRCRCRLCTDECSKRAQTEIRMSFFREKRRGFVKTA
ncbi:hypothetical protein [Pseudomonas sp. CHM02]|uniref:hypothetical protein n=1 Tax=Pseudomonas sp. CHM02 TaxID=1463662 RepID=UPI0012DCD880|nr:hypothetical protein [Pseudomonas sp. CHM02]